MIGPDDVMPLLLEACPSFAGRWKAYFESEYSQGEERLHYLDVAEFVRHLVNLYERDKTDEFSRVFTVIERLHAEGDGFVRELATIGILEGLQNLAAEHQDEFAKYLGPESTKWWQELDDFWQGRIPYVGAGVNRRKQDRDGGAM